MIAVVLAAGKATRFGECKQVALLDSKPLLQYVVEALPPEIPKIVVVGAFRAQVESLAGDLNISTVYNPKFATGIGSSVKLAAELALQRDTDLLLTLADLPFVSREDYESLITSFSGRAVFSRFSDTIGPPAIFPKRKLDRFFSLRGDQGAKAVFPEALTVPMRNAARDIDYKRNLRSSAGAQEV